MKTALPPIPMDDGEEVFELVETLNRTEQRLEELTAGEVDSVVDRQGQTFFLRRAQQELRFSESVRQAAILNALPAQIALLDTQGIIVSVNDSWRRFATNNALQGPGFCVGTNYVEICESAVGECSEEAHAAATGIRQVLLGEEKEFTLEYPCHSPTERRWFRLVVTPVDSEHLAGAVIMHVNITERINSEEALRSSETRMAIGQRIAHLGSWELNLVHPDDLGAYPLQWSDEMFRIAGYEPGAVKVTRELFYRLVPLEEHAKLQQAVMVAISGHKPYSMVHRLIRPNGEERIIHEQAHVVFDEKTGQPSKIVGTSHDITEEKKANEELLSKTALLEAQLNSTPDGIIIVNSEGKLVLQNRKMIDLWNPPREIFEELDHRKRLEWVATQVADPQQFSERVDYLYAHPDEIGRDELELINGKIFDRYVAPIIGRDGRNFGKIWAYRDITERKQAGAQLSSKTALLEAQLNSTSDGILIVDCDGNKIIQNQQMIDMWHIPQEFADDPVDQRQREWVTGQMKNPREFAEKIDYLYAHQDEIGRDELELVDGRIFDRYSSPVRGKAGELYGRIWAFRDITTRKLAEEQLSSKTALLEAQLNSTLDGILVVDNEGKTILQNQHLLDLWNVPYESVQGVTYPQRIDAITRQVKHSRPFLEKVAHIYGHPDEISRDEVELINGTCLDRYSAPVRGKDGQTYGRIWCFRDITERKRSEARFRLLVDSNVQGVLFWNRKGGITGANDAFLRIVGYTREDLEAGRINWMKLTPSKYAAFDQKCLEQIDANRICPPYEKEYIRKDGSLVPVIIGSAAFEDNPDSGVAFVIDITERKRSESRFRRLVDSNAQSVFFYDRNGGIKDANDSFLNLVGYTREDLEAGRVNWMAMTPPEYADREVVILETLDKTGVCGPYEKEYIRKDGSRVPILIGTASYEDNPNEGVVFVLDLTERKKLENQFLRAQRMESIGTLAGGIAHDLNNSLAPIMMSIDLLRMKFTDPASQELLATLSSSAQRGADMVRQVLSFARGVEGQRMEVQSRHVIKDVEKIATDTFLKHIQVRTIIGRDPWTIMGDPTQVHQVLLNLCVNARDAMPDGGTLTISTENILVDEHYAGLVAEAQSGPYLLLQVEDTGSGMPPGVIEKIFDPFFTTKEIGKGTGLGLSTSLAIVKSHGGFMRVYSEVGKGTKFKVYFPAQTEISSETAEEIAAEMPRGNGEIILVVDDEASVRHITQQTLQAFGYRVILASDGAEALSIFARQGAEIAVILTDMMMPVMDGPALIRVLRKLKPTLPIIGASGLSANKNVSQSGSLGINHFLPKPYMANELLKILREILSAKIGIPDLHK